MLISKILPSLAALFAFLCSSSLLLAQDRLVVAYVPNWVNLGEFSKHIAYEKLTHINIAFENPTDDSGKLSFHEGNRQLIDAAHAHNVKVLVSIGGGAVSGKGAMQSRYFDLMSATRRKSFAASLYAYVVEHNFDGIDIDIEGPSINEDYGPFIEELSLLFKPNQKLLTSALSKGYGGDKVSTETLNKFDFVNIMAYDGAGSWAPDSPGQHSSFEFAKSNTEYWLERGLPKTKAVLGLPFYGYGFGQDFKKGGIGYDTILAAHPGAEKLDKVGNTIWYNGIPTIKAKCQYVVDQDLAGVMIWSLDNDVDDERSLLKAADSVLNPR